MIKTLNKTLVYVLAFSFSIPAEAKDFGIQGELFSIKEENLLLALQKQLSSKFSAAAYKQLLKETEERAKHPKSPLVPSDAQQNHMYYYDPTFTAEETIKDSKGNVMVSKGTQVNPLKNLQLSSGLLFLNGDNPSHLKWARQQEGLFKWVLVQGNPYELELEEQRPIYFDQHGFSLSKFKIQHIPARVTQDGILLKIEEIALKEQS
jgi:conjugal transfer pilus assembly protein TraW